MNPEPNAARADGTAAKYHAVLYFRVGSKKQVNEDFSIAVQQQLLRSYAETSHFSVLDGCVEFEQPRINDDRRGAI
jgi:hypothetical protein